MVNDKRTSHKKTHLRNIAVADGLFKSWCLYNTRKIIISKLNYIPLIWVLYTYLNC